MLLSLAQSASKFRTRLFQTAVDPFTNRIVCWVTKISQARVASSLEEPSSKVGSRSSKRKASLLNDLSEELWIEWMDLELQNLCFEFLEELRPGVIFQWNYSLERRTIRKYLFCLVFLFAVEHQNSANLPKKLQNGLRRGQTTKNRPCHGFRRDLVE